MTEQEFLAAYDGDRYKKPSVAADIVAFAAFSQEEENYRKLPQYTLNVLLVKRGEHPYQGYWALPGGFVRPEETAEETAARELFEETGVKDVYMEQLYTYSAIKRDPRARVMSISYLALMLNRQNLAASADAVSAAWFTVALTKTGSEKTQWENGVRKKTRYCLSLKNEEALLKANIVCDELFLPHDHQKTYKIEDAEGIAFDHAKIIVMAVERLRNKLDYTDIGFYLLPERFTLTTLQKVHEVILSRELLAANFRRKIMDKVEETPYMVEGGGHRSAKLYRQKIE